MRLVVFLLAISTAVYCQPNLTDDPPIQTVTCKYQAPFPRVYCYIPSVQGWRWFPPLPMVTLPPAARPIISLPPAPQPIISIPVNDNFSKTQPHQNSDGAYLYEE
uniref:Secreted protein n=1 Tax=Haemonchus contortus TaxID=6289 RepID=A0A7I4YIS3_HAECO|nr:unnamed protein product [Haemonchus contortus]